MARTPAQIEEILRLMLTGKSHGEITEQLYPGAENRITIGVWHRFKTNFLLNEAFGRNFDKISKALADAGYNLSANELAGLISIAHSAPAKPGRKAKGASAGQRRWSSGTSMGTTPSAAPAKGPVKLTEEEIQKSLTIRNTWLMREGIPYAKADDDACTQTVGTIPGNVCGETISVARLNRGCTTCQQCHEAVRAPGSAKPMHPTSTYTGR